MDVQGLPKVVQDCHRCLQWMIPAIDKFPRNRRFTLGEKIETRLLDVLGLLIESTYSQRNRQMLQSANAHLNVIRHLWRLAYELKAVAQKSYQHGAKLLVEIGRQIGGWQRGAG